MELNNFGRVKRNIARAERAAVDWMLHVAAEQLRDGNGIVAACTTDIKRTGTTVLAGLQQQF